MKTMTTVSEVLNILNDRGYTVDFNLQDNCLICNQNSFLLHPDEFVVDKHYRFEGPSDPGDEAVVYAISSDKYKIKGTLVDGYGISSDAMTGEMVKALKEKVLENNAESFVVSNGNMASEELHKNVHLEDSMFELDLLSYRKQIKLEEAWKKNDRNALTLYKGKGMRIVMMALHEGAGMKTHTAAGIISVQVLEGNIKFSTDTKTANLKEGELLVLKAGVPHSVIATTEAIFLLTLANSPIA